MSGTKQSTQQPTENDEGRPEKANEDENRCRFCDVDLCQEEEIGVTEEMAKLEDLEPTLEGFLPLSRDVCVPCMVNVVIKSERKDITARREAREYVMGAIGR